MAEVWIRMDVGSHKDLCEDAVLVGRKIYDAGFYNLDVDLPCVFAVADGVGGNPGARDASRFVLRRLAEACRPGLSPEDLVSLMLTVDSELIDHASFIEGKESMATTVTLVIVEEDRAVSAQVGNTRLLEIRGGKFRQITHDQTARQILLDAGNYAGARDYGDAELLGFMGGGSVEGIAYLKVAELWKGSDRPDQLLLSSDGIHDHVDPSRFGTVYAASSAFPRRMFNFIFNEAVKNLSSDDKSLVLIRL